MLNQTQLIENASATPIKKEVATKAKEKAISHWFSETGSQTPSELFDWIVSLNQNEDFPCGVTPSEANEDTLAYYAKEEILDLFYEFQDAITFGLNLSAKKESFA